MRSIRPSAVALVSACAIVVVIAPGASALSTTARNANRLPGTVSDGAAPTGALGPLLHHGPLFGHLPPVSDNMEIIGRLNLFSPSTGEHVLPGQIADLAVHKGFAYLNSWDNVNCVDGGTFVVDIRNPADPKQVAFMPAQAPYYHGEGAHVVTINTPQFQGDLLAVNDETYGSNVEAPCEPLDKTGGGFDLYDVTDPTHPRTLVQNAGDRSPESSLVQDETLAAKSYHSVFVWQDGPRAFLLASDNTELSDIDIFDITDPANPEFISDFDPILQLPQAAQIIGTSAHGNAIFHHDSVVKRIDGHLRMLVSYWDAGYLQLNVDDPAHPTYITDTSFDGPDPLVAGVATPEGNAHEAEYSHDSEFFLAADEDFATDRTTSTITQAPFAGVALEAVTPPTTPIPPATTIAGSTVFVGLGCIGTVAPPPPGVTIAVAERGVCTFQEKAQTIEAAGYEMGVIFNNDVGGDGGRCEVLINMAIDPGAVGIPMTFVGRADGMRLLNNFDPNTYQCTGDVVPTPGDTQSPPVGTLGLTAEFARFFDGWGYAHLYDANTSQLLDSFAIPEGIDDRYSVGFGDLSIHEVATDPETNLAYLSYYNGGLRVLRYSRAGGLEQVGRFIDEGGSNFWGVEQFTDAAGNRLIAGSDRDYGLQIVKYTGPGAVLAKPAAAPAPAPGAAAAPSSEFGFGSLRRVTIRNRRATVTITVPGAGKAKATLKANIGRRAVPIASSSRTATGAGRVRFSFQLTRAAERSLRRTLARRPTRRTGGVLKVTFQATGGVARTRNRSLSIAIGR